MDIYFVQRLVMSDTETNTQTSNPIPLETVLLIGVANILVFYWIKKLFLKRNEDEEGSFNVSFHRDINQYNYVNIMFVECIIDRKKEWKVKQ